MYIAKCDTVLGYLDSNKVSNFHLNQVNSFCAKKVLYSNAEFSVHSLVHNEFQFGISKWIQRHHLHQLTTITIYYICNMCTKLCMLSTNYPSSKLKMTSGTQVSKECDNLWGISNSFQSYWPDKHTPTPNALFVLIQPALN